MKPNQDDAPPAVSEQYELQLRVHRARATAWIPWIFVAGLGFSALGLTTSIVWFREEGSSALRVILLALALVFFGWTVVSWLTWPLWLRPRIVPYFARRLGEYGGRASTAFEGGGALYREIVALDTLAATLGARPLSAFGFADDHYGQEVHWHSASEGLRTVDTLRQGLGTLRLTVPGVAIELEALASVLDAAAERGVDFSLVLRLHKRDSVQGVMAVESREGSFW